ncbi:cyclophilin-like fold protein [Clavibacter zhangzhiyongii]|uniref:cyclophilin-like fold protein n=1 Tax=Clavibacter zhangzhiyongii TaxID=2768071 RepID=UPI0039E07408
MTPIVIEVDGQQMPGELDGSATSASLIDQLPLTLPFRDYGGQEKVAELPAPLNLDGAPEGSDAPALAIGYYVPDQRLVLYYDDVSYYAGIVPLGTYDDTIGLEGRTDPFTVTIRVAG